MLKADWNNDFARKTYYDNMGRDNLTGGLKDFCVRMYHLEEMQNERPDDLFIQEGEE